MARTSTDEPSAGTTNAEAPARNPGLKALDKLIGTWKISGEATGKTTYEWMDGGFFLIARGEIEQGGKKTKHIEIIGYDHAPWRCAGRRHDVSHLHQSRRHPQLHARGRREGHDHVVRREGLARGLQGQMER